MTTTYIMQALIILCTALGWVNEPRPTDKQTIDAQVQALVQAHAANGIQMPGPVYYSYVGWMPAGALGGAKGRTVVLSTRLRAGAVQHMAPSTIAHELGHVWAPNSSNETALEVIGIEALAWQARRDPDAFYAFVYNLRRRFGIIYIYRTDNDGFLLQQGFTEAEIAEMRGALKEILKEARRFDTYYDVALPTIQRLARRGEPLVDEALGLRFFNDDTAAVLEAIGLIHIYRPKAVRMLEMP